MSSRRLFYLLVSVVWANSSASFAIEPQNVLVVYNEDNADSAEIASYYSQLRSGVHVAALNGIDAITSGSFDEDVSAQDYLDVIRPQVLAAIQGVSDPIDVIVTTKGLPLRIDAGPDPGTSLSWKRFSSLESELTRIDSIDSIDAMGDQFFFIGLPQFDTTKASNPYYNSSTPFVRAGSDPVNGDIRLSARLDGYSVESVKIALDRAQQTYVVPSGHAIVADDTGFDSLDQMTNSTGAGPGMVEAITSLYGADPESNPLLFEQTNQAVTATDRSVIGYVSHGLNDGSLGLSSDYLGEFVADEFVPGEIQFDLADGAVFLTHESFNSQSFDPGSDQPQGMIADWIERGGTAGVGHVAEPFNGPDNVTNEDIFYQLILPSGGSAAEPGQSGLTFVEAAWASTRQLSYVNTVVGDPLMRWQQWLPGDINLDGTVNGTDFSILQPNFFQTGSFEQGDLNGDGVVNGTDFSIMQPNFFRSVGNPTPTLSSVPEPSSVLLACACAAALGVPRYSRRRVL